MAAIGHLIFCRDCGDLLPPSKGDVRNRLTCACCGAENPDIASKVIITCTKPSDFPSLLRQKLSQVQTVARHKLQTERVDPNATCEKCQHQGVKYVEMQTRSADEGSTIMYNCDCGNKWTLNN